MEAETPSNIIPTSYIDLEKSLVHDMKILIGYIQDEIDKRQYFNALYNATILTRKLVEAFNTVLKRTDHE